MNNLNKFTLVDNETQLDEDEDCEYEIYGLSKSWGGVIFERDINNPKQVLFHISNGLKVVYDYLNENEYFFRKGDNFFMHYKSCEDFNYSKKVKELTKENIIKVVKEYIYIHHPNLMQRTLMGWDIKKGVLHDPNHCSAYVRLDNNKYYSITKYKDKVTINICKDNKKGREKDNLEFIADFSLNEKMYVKALDFSFIKRKIYMSFYGKLSDEKLEEYLKLKSELENFINDN